MKASLVSVRPELISLTQVKMRRRGFALAQSDARAANAPPGMQLQGASALRKQRKSRRCRRHAVPCFPAPPPVQIQVRDERWYAREARAAGRGRRWSAP